MPAITNTQTTSETVTGLDIEFVEMFNQEYSRLAEILGIFDVETMKAGAAMYRYVVIGELNNAVVAEGDEVPLS